MDTEGLKEPFYLLRSKDQGDTIRTLTFDGFGSIRVRYDSETMEIGNIDFGNDSMSGTGFIALIPFIEEYVEVREVVTELTDPGYDGTHTREALFFTP